MASVQGEFDYIVVGAGSAGCVLASRLSEDKNVNVLLIDKRGPSNERGVAFSRLRAADRRNGFRSV